MSMTDRNAQAVVTAYTLSSALGVGNAATLRALWARVVVRVAGSWIAASGLFMLGWAVRRG